MANDKFYIISDNDISIPIVDAAGQPVIDATVTVSIFENILLAIGNADTPIQEVQTLVPSAKSTAGTFMLGYHGDWTAALPYDESLANIKTALEGLDGIGADNVIVTGKQLNDADFAEGMIFTFGRNFGEAFRLDFDFTSLIGPSQNFSIITQTVQGISEGVALDLGGGKVGLPVPGIVDVYANMFVRIVGTRNYNGQWEVDPLLSTKSRLAITATYVYEEFDGRDLVYFGALNGKDISMPYDTDAYYGIIPSTLAGFVANDIAVIFVTAVSGSIQRVFQAKPIIQF